MLAQFGRYHHPDNWRALIPHGPDHLIVSILFCDGEMRAGKLCARLRDHFPGEAVRIDILNLLAYCRAFRDAFHVTELQRKVHTIRLASPERELDRCLGYLLATQVLPWAGSLLRQLMVSRITMANPVLHLPFAMQAEATTRKGPPSAPRLRPDAQALRVTPSPPAV